MTGESSGQTTTPGNHLVFLIGGIQDKIFGRNIDILCSQTLIFHAPLLEYKLMDFFEVPSPFNFLNT